MGAGRQASSEPVESVTASGVVWRVGDWTRCSDPGPLEGDGIDSASALPPALLHRRRIGRLWVRDLVTSRLRAPWPGFAPQVTRRKPRLAGAALIDVSIAHSGSTLLAAVVADGLVGADVEEPPFIAFQRDSLVRRMCGAGELARLDALPVGIRSRTLARWWTVKEATLKAHGIGLAGDPSRIRTDSVPLPENGATGAELAIVRVTSRGEPVVELPVIRWNDEGPSITMLGPSRGRGDRI